VKVLYRISRAKYAGDLSGEGSRLGGGRWNHKGTAVLYTTENRSLAALEALVHMSSPDFLIGRKMVSLAIPETIVPKEIDPLSLPKDWRKYPPPFALADIGTTWAARRESLLLRVPSAVVPQEYNILINPSHPEMEHVKIIEVDDFVYDSRLHKTSRRQDKG
jgi:RES domain-containing protein